MICLSSWSLKSNDALPDTAGAPNLAGGAPVSGAEIVIAGKTYVTDRQGQARIEVGPGSIDFTVVKEGFVPVTSTVIVGEGQQQAVSIALDKPPSVQRRVSPSLAPIALPLPQI